MQELEPHLAGSRALGLSKPLYLEQLHGRPYALDLVVDLRTSWTRTEMTTTAILFHEELSWVQPD